jgi:hypothetical protein
MYRTIFMLGRLEITRPLENSVSALANVGRDAQFHADVGMLVGISNKF